MTDQIRNTEAEINAIWNATPDGWGRRTYFAPVYPLISRLLVQIGTTGNLLDLGCGNGNKSVVFDRLGFSVTGIDKDPAMIDKASSACPEGNFICQDIEQGLPFPDNYFDVAFSASLFQYVDHAFVWKECMRVLKKDGYMIMLENLKHNPFSRLGRRIRKISNFQYRNYPWNHLTYGDMQTYAGMLDMPSIDFFHCLSTLAMAPGFGKLYPALAAMDAQLLKMPYCKKLAWLCLLSGRVRK